MYDLGEGFKINESNLIPHTNTIFSGKKYRITVLTEGLVRLEYSEDGKFNDQATLLVNNRNFGKPRVVVYDDFTFLRIETKYFKLTYVKETKFSSNTLYATIIPTKKEWYYGNKEVRNFGGTTTTLDNMKKLPNLDKGLFSTDGYVTIDDSKMSIMDKNCNVITNNNDKSIDLYLFAYGNDFGICLKDYFTLTGFPEMIPRYAIGTWWSRDDQYTSSDINDLITKFARNNIPLSVLLLSDGWSKRDLNKYKYVENGFSFDEKLISHPDILIKSIHDEDIKFGVKVNPFYGFYPFENYFKIAQKYFNANKQGYIDFTPYNPKMMDLYLKVFIHSLQNMHVDFFWCDYNSKNRDEIFIINDYMHRYLKLTGKRSLILSRNSGIASHRYNILYSGKICVDWDSLKMLPYFNLTSSNIGISWWSHDIGGSVGGIEDSDLYLRSIQLGVFSPILRFNTEHGHYYKREPWKWDVVTDNIATYYLRLRNRLIPYIYSEAYVYHKVGNPLIMPFYYNNLDFYDDPNYVNQYYFGNSFMISPIINKMDEFINRTVQRFYIPSGVWYDFKTGKRFLGDHKYISFYRIEDYPIFVRAGSIIPLAGEKSFMKVDNPKDFDIHIFPGKNNTYHLYEDDGETYNYERGKYMITEIDYNYRASNYTVIIRSIKKEVNIVPKVRDYRIVFRNTKKADNVEVYLNESKYLYETVVTDTDFIVIVKNVPTNTQLVINCYGKDIEIDAVKLIKDDIDSIIFDLKIETKLKDSIANIMFSEQNLNKKRIEIRKLKNQGLDKRSIKIFLKLLEYMEM